MSDRIHSADAIVGVLISEGWRETSHGLRKESRLFYKRFDTPTRCQCNDGKLGLQVCCYVYEIPMPARAVPVRVSYELELVGQLSDGTWVELRQYSLPADIRQGLAVIPRMLATWEHIANLQTLARCPFCGKAAVVRAPNLIHCEDVVNCCAQVDVGDHGPRTAEFALESWNRRVGTASVEDPSR